MHFWIHFLREEYAALVSRIWRCLKPLPAAHGVNWYKALVFSTWSREAARAGPPPRAADCAADCRVINRPYPLSPLLTTNLLRHTNINANFLLGFGPGKTKQQQQQQTQFPEQLLMDAICVLFGRNGHFADFIKWRISQGNDFNNVTFALIAASRHRQTD